MSKGFEVYDKEQCCENAKQWLLGYERWRDLAAKKNISVGGISYDGMPSSQNYEPDARIIDFANATNQCKQRERLLDYMRSKGDIHEVYSLILDERFVHHHRSVIALCTKLHMSERTFLRMQKQALWEAARIIPDSSIMVKKSGS